MSIRNLDLLFAPRSIAVIGASRRPGSVGAVVARNLLEAGFDGPVMPVNPHERSVHSTLAYAAIGDLPMTPDLAVICTPPPTVPGLVAELGARGTKAVIVITAGFTESGPGSELRQPMLDAAKPHLLRIVGPNCLGVMVPARGINASFVHVNPLPGDLALIGQSGAVVTSLVDWATARGIGFSHLVSLGDMIDVDVGDLLDYFAADGGTRAILLYVEALTHARKFMSAARAAARAKPVIVIKAGRSAEGAKAAASHTGALAGSFAVYEAAFRRAGMLRVDDLDELFDAVGTLASGLGVGGDRLAILTNGGGLGVLATDRLVAEGGRVAALSPATFAALDQALPPIWSRGNPVDIVGDAGPDRYRAALSAVLKDEGNDAVLVINCPVAVADSTEAARAVVDTAAAARGRPVLTSWVGETSAHEPRRLFAERKIPTYDTPDKAVRAFMHLVRYRRNQTMLRRVPPSVPELFAVDTAAARAVIEPALGEGRPWLSEVEAKQVLAAYGVPVVRTRTVRSPEQAERCAAEFGVPVALKILSPDITHKSDVGGVQLNLLNPKRVRRAAEAMLERVREAAPQARIDGFTVQEMAARKDAVELIVGAAEDPLFGPVLLFGHGGTAVEVIDDKALALPPLDALLAREMMAATRVHKLLRGYRSTPPAALDAIALTLMKVSQLVIDVPEIAELDINPLLADADGVLALDARIKVGPPRAARLAIRPYPKRLEKVVRILDGREFLLRPIRPEDEPLVHAMVEATSPEDLRLRFFAPLKRLSPQLAARLTQIDYDREMALVAVAPGTAGSGEAGEPVIYGVVRIAADPDNLLAEYAVLVRSDMKGKGLGFRLMTEILDYARARGIRRVRGDVLAANTTMLHMCEELGFVRRRQPDDPSIMEVEIELAKDAA